MVVTVFLSVAAGAALGALTTGLLCNNGCKECEETVKDLQEELFRSRMEGLEDFPAIFRKRLDP